MQAGLADCQAMRRACFHFRCEVCVLAFSQSRVVRGSGSSQGCGRLGTRGQGADCVNDPSDFVSVLRGRRHPDGYGNERHLVCLHRVRPQTRNQIERVDAGSKPVSEESHKHVGIALSRSRGTTSRFFEPTHGGYFVTPHTRILATFPDTFTIINTRDAALPHASRQGFPPRRN